MHQDNSMNRRLRFVLPFVLPLIQVALAHVLMLSNAARPVSSENSNWKAPDRQFCEGLNAPATIAFTAFQQKLDHSFIVVRGAYLLLVWLLWYCVIIEINRRYLGRSRPF